VKSDDAVLLVANYESDVGYAWWLMEWFWCRVADAMRRDGRRSIIAFPRINIIPESLKATSAQIIEHDFRSQSMAEVIRSGILIRRLGIRSVYLTDWPSVRPAYGWWRLNGVRIIVLHIHTLGDRPHLYGPKAWIKSLAHRVRPFACDRYVGVSEGTWDSFVQNWHVPKERCTVVKNGIQPFDCRPGSRARIRRLLGLPMDAVVVGLVSRATYHKGLDFAVRCLAEIGARTTGRAPIYFVHCGDGPNLQEFRALAIQLGVAERIRFLGRRPDVREILCACDLAFHPSRHEGLSLSTLEFMCAGLPVVVPDIPSVCAPIHHLETGLVYRAEDIGSGTDALASLARDGGQRREMGQRARQECLKQYTLESTGRIFDEQVVPWL